MNKNDELIAKLQESEPTKFLDLYVDGGLDDGDVCMTFDYNYFEKEVDDLVEYVDGVEYLFFKYNLAISMDHDGDRPFFRIKGSGK